MSTQKQFRKKQNQAQISAQQEKEIRINHLTQFIENGQDAVTALARDLANLLLKHEQTSYQLQDSSCEYDKQRWGEIDDCVKIVRHRLNTKARMVEEGLGRLALMRGVQDGSRVETDSSSDAETQSEQSSDDQQEVIQ